MDKIKRITKEELLEIAVIKGFDISLLEFHSGQVSLSNHRLLFQAIGDLF